MNNKVKFILTVAVSLLLLTTFVMGNSLVAHDYLHGRGDAATLAVRWAVVIAIPLAMLSGYLIARHRSFVWSNAHGSACDGKAPPQSSESRKSRDELRMEFNSSRSANSTRRTDVRLSRNTSTSSWFHFLMMTSPWICSSRTFDIGIFRMTSNSCLSHLNLVTGLHLSTSAISYGISVNVWDGAVSNARSLQSIASRSP